MDDRATMLDTTTSTAHGEQNRARDVFLGLVRIEDYSFRARQGFTTRLAMPGVPVEDPHPFAGSATGFAFGRRLRCRFTDAAGTVLFSGDAILLWWGDDSRRGKRMELALDADHAAPHPFAGAVAGRRDGDVLDVIIQDDPDSSVPPPGERFLRRRLLGLAHDLPGDPNFRAWFLTHVDGSWGPDEEDIAAGLKSWCGISSRKDLLADGAQAERARGRLRALIAEFRMSDVAMLDQLPSARTHATLPAVAKDPKTGSDPNKRNALPT